MAWEPKKDHQIVRQFERQTDDVLRKAEDRIRAFLRRVQVEAAEERKSERLAEIERRLEALEKDVKDLQFLENLTANGL